LKTGVLSVVEVGAITEKKPSPLIAMLVATVEDEIVPAVVMVCSEKAVTPPAGCWLGVVAVASRSSNAVLTPL